MHQTHQFDYPHTYSISDKRSLRYTPLLAVRASHFFNFFSPVSTYVYTCRVAQCCIDVSLLQERARSTTPALSTTHYAVSEEEIGETLQKFACPPDCGNF
jgi:hypothetical protein